MDQFSLLGTSPSSLATIALNVEGMKCAGCVQAVEKRLTQHPGVLSASVNLVTQVAMVRCEAGATVPEDLASTLTKAGFPSQPREQQAQEATATTPDREAVRRQQLFAQIQRVIIAGVLVILSGLGHLGQMQGLRMLDLSNMWFHGGLATIALFGPGRSMLIDGWNGLWRNTPNMNTLVGLGTLTAYAASLVALLFPSLNWECFFDEPVMIVGLILLGRTLEQQARDRAASDFRALLSLQPRMARWIPQPLNPHHSVEVPVEQIRVGTGLQVLSGEKFPVDGEIMTGKTTIDESMLTGESLPVFKGPSDPVIGGTLNQSGAVTLQATRTGQDTTLAQIIAQVEAAQTRKAPVQRLADITAGYFTYGVIAIAALTFLFWYFVGTHFWPDLVSSPLSHHQALTSHVAAHPLLLSLKLAIAVLVVACPCALGLATPTAILVGTSLGAERGLLIRGGDVLEQVHQLDTVVFDKTGTLTLGQLTVTDCWVAAAKPELTPDRLLQIAATVESGVRHPLSQAIQQQAQAQELPLLPVQDFHAEPGLGVSAWVEGQRVCLGTFDWLSQQGISISPVEQDRAISLTGAGKSLVYVAIASPPTTNASTFAGVIALTDTLRPDAVETVSSLQSMGLQVMVLTGDRRSAAEAIVRPLNLTSDQVLAEVRPAQKAAMIAQLQAEGRRVAMVGDGSNDAPALAQADVGIALRSGTDVAVETAQIVLMRDWVDGESHLTDVFEAIRLSCATFRKIQQNLFWAFAYNTLGIPIAAGVLLPTLGILLSPAAAGAMMAFSSVSVVTNSLLLRWTCRSVD